jgi:hypothetical protein
MIERLKTFVRNLGWRGYLYITGFFLMVYIGVDIFIKEGDIFLVYFMAGVVIATSLRRVILQRTSQFAFFTNIIVIAVFIIGLATYINAVDAFIDKYDAVIGSVVFFLVGFLLIGSFWIYSDPDIVMER